MSDKKPLIPQNEDDYFHFSKNLYMTSVVVFFNHLQPVEVENLYLIFQTYLWKKELLLKAVYISVENTLEHTYNKKISVLHHVRLESLQKMSYIDFQQWYEDLYAEDSEKYLINYKYYGFQFQFFKKSKFWETNNVYPSYPWDEHFKMNFLKKYRYISENIKLRQERKKLEYMNKKLLKIIKLLKKNKFR